MQMEAATKFCRSRVLPPSRQVALRRPRAGGGTTDSYHALQPHLSSAACRRAYNFANAIQLDRAVRTEGLDQWIANAGASKF